MQKIGIIVAVEEELRPLLEYLGREIHSLGNYDKQFAHKAGAHYLKESDTLLCYILSSYGEISAAMSTQFLIDTFHVDKIINYGVVGSLSDYCRVGDIGFVPAVVHYDFGVLIANGFGLKAYPTSRKLYFSPNSSTVPNELLLELSLKEFMCASADKFVEKGEAKRRLNSLYSADICDMEAAGIVITCNRNNIPCTIIKGVSDGVEDGIEVFQENVYTIAKKCVDIVMQLV